MTTLKPDAFEEVRPYYPSRSPCVSLVIAFQIFVKLEEESERRAIMMQAEEARISSHTPDIAIAVHQPAQRRSRYRGSISISRFGQVSTTRLHLRTASR